MTVTVLTGDCRTVLPTLDAGSVRCCVTSPPYYGLRDYGTAAWEGGDPACDHSGVARRCDAAGRNDKQSTQKGSSSDRPSNRCLRCGATRVDSQIGLEQTPDEYVAKLVAVFREVRRVLTDDGTLWVNLGDSYASSTKGSGGGWAADPTNYAHKAQAYGARKFNHDVKPKDLIGIPWRVAFALQADGWYLRSDIIWAKPNPMPESVTDRPTKAHEYLFLLAKSERYYYDAAAIREEFADERMGNPGVYRAALAKAGDATLGTHGRGVTGRGWNADAAATGRNRRSVWTVATQPYRGAHFATFPPDLITPCILAGSAHGDTVLDPFGGAGTVGTVASRYARNAVLIDLNPAYVAMADARIADTPMGLAL